MDILRCTKKRKIIRENEVTEENKRDKDIHQSELCTQSIKQSEEFYEQDRETFKMLEKHCNWIKFNSGDYSLTQFTRSSFKRRQAYKETFDRLKKYILDELNVCDSSQECKVSPR